MPELMVMTGTPAATAALMLLLQAVGVGHRDDEAVGARRDGVVDQRRLLTDVGVALVVQVDALVLAGLLGAGLHDVPERVAGSAVGDRRRCGCRQLPHAAADRCRAVVLCRLLPLSPSSSPLVLQPVSTSSPAATPTVSTRRIFMVFLLVRPRLADCRRWWSSACPGPHWAVGKLNWACWCSAWSTCGHRAVTTLARV